MSRLQPLQIQTENRSNSADFLHTLEAKGVQFWLEGEKLRCRAPKNVLTSALFKQIQQKKADLLLLLQRREQAKPYPLSHGQRALWFIHQLAPENPAYNIMCTLRLVPQLDVDLLEQAVEALLERHPSLRTTYTYQNGMPVQQIHERSALEGYFNVIDAHIDGRDWQTWALEEADKPFDLEKGPVIRMILRRDQQKQEFILFVVIHHLASDLVSQQVMLDDLAKLYKAMRQKKAKNDVSEGIEREPTSTYRDYVEWESTYLREHGQRLEDYWLQQLSGELPGLNLPTDRPRPPIQTYWGDDYIFEFDAKLTQPLRALGRANNATLYMTLLAAFQALIYRYTNQEDFLLGTPTDNRSQADFEKVIGYYVNPVVLRADLSGNPSFVTLLQRVRQVMFGALKHQAYPFPLLVETLQPVRDPSRSPLFQIEFVWDQFLQPLYTAGELISETLPSGQRGAEFDLSLTMVDMDNSLKGLFRYNTDLFDHSTIERMAGHFLTLLAGIVENPTQPIATLPILTEAERNQLIVDWNNTGVDIPQERCFHELFEAQVQRTPDAIAVLFEEGNHLAGNHRAAAPYHTPSTLTYQELNQQANRLAHILVQRGVRPGVIVALLAERTPDFLSAILAVFKAGGAYLPLDPFHPSKRLSQILMTSQADIVLTTPAFVSVLQDTATDAQILILDELLAYPTDHQGQNENLPLRCGTDDLAYVIFTSGSTGLPKGAMVEQKGMLNHLYAKVHDLELSQADKIAQNAPQTFDISVWQFLAGLLVGGQTYIYHDNVSRDPRQLLEHVSQNGVTILEVVPSLLRFMLEEIKRTPFNLARLRWLIPTGEALLPTFARQWFAHYPHIPMLNAYGPTECSDDVTHYPIYEPPDETVVNMPIGRPVANMRMYILDRHLQPVPIGIPGELYVAGIGVGRGYLNDSTRTEQAFISTQSLPNCPVAHESRLYKTGDLVRYLPDGNIEFLGRVDYQVKVRGFRIELGEIENVLLASRGVREAVVLAREHHRLQGDKRLVGYFVGDANSDSLRQHLSQRLPDYMIPSAFVQLDAMPLTANGKLNRRALPEPNYSARQGGADAQTGFVAPRNVIEQQVADIWASVLGIENVGVYDDFFALGGHSLLATQVASRINEQIMINVPIASMFQYSKLEELASFVSMLEASTHAPSEDEEFEEI